MKRKFGAFYFIMFFTMAATQPFLSLYLSQKGLSDAQIGFLFAASASAGILSQPILGYINDHAKDPRRLLLLSFVLAPIVYAGYSLSIRYWVLILVAVVCVIVQSTASITDAMTIRAGSRYGFTYGEIRLWGALSFAVSTMVAGYFYHQMGIGIFFWVYGALSVVLVLNTLLLPKEDSMAQAEHKVVQRQKQEPVLRGIWNVAKNRSLMTFTCICFILSIAISTNFSFLPLYYEELHYPLGWVGLNFTLAALVEVPFFYLSGKMMEKWGLMRVILIASVSFTLKYAIMAFAPGPIVVILIQVLDGIGYSLFWSAAVQQVSYLAPAGRATTAQTLFGAISGSLSGIVGSSVGGWVLGSLGPLWMYGFTAILGTLSVVGFLLFARMHRTQIASQYAEGTPV